MCACVRACVRACVSACVRVCVCVCGWVYVNISCDFHSLCEQLLLDFKMFDTNNLHTDFWGSFAQEMVSLLPTKMLQVCGTNEKNVFLYDMSMTRSLSAVSPTLCVLSPICTLYSSSCVQGPLNTMVVG